MISPIESPRSQLATLETESHMLNPRNYIFDGLNEEINVCVMYTLAFLVEGKGKPMKNKEKLRFCYNIP